MLILRGKNISLCNVVLLSAVFSAQSFTISVSSSHVSENGSAHRDAFQTRRDETRRNLMPEQGSQLVAASCAVRTQNVDDETDESVQSKSASISPARSFISRMFNLSHGDEREEAQQEIINFSSDESEDDEALLYPIVGFEWVAVNKDGSEKEYVVLPTTCNPSCSIKGHSDEVYGWFSQSCKLGSIFDDDDIAYCAPK